MRRAWRDALESVDTAPDHVPSFRTSVANSFKGNNSIILDLFNGPYPDNINSGSMAIWHAAAGWQQLATKSSTS
jgi:hypothetical protein